MYDLLVKGGKLIDAEQGINDYRDIGISKGKIEAVAVNIAPSEAKKVIDAKNRIVTPGLIDIHAHIADGIIRQAVPPDDFGIRAGVTAICDGGSTGYANFDGFKRYVLPHAKTDAFFFLHMCPHGLALSPNCQYEIRDWVDIDTDAMIALIEENRDRAKGIKMRAIKSVVENVGLAAMKKAKEVASQVKLPLMVHLGELTPERKELDQYTRDLLPLLEKGDIVLHIYTPHGGGPVLPDGSMMPEILEAQKRGVILDETKGFMNFSFERAHAGMDKGLIPDNLTTDGTLWLPPSRRPMVFCRIMSKFLALGMSLDEVIKRATINPARAISEEHRRGSLKVGMPADVTILELCEGDFTFVDDFKDSIKGHLLLTPRITLKDGIEFIAHEGPPNTDISHDSPFKRHKPY